MATQAAEKKSIVDVISQKLMPVAAKLAANRYIGAVRDGYIALMPLIITASLFTLINSVILGENGLCNMLFGNPFTEAQQLGAAVSSATMSVLALMLAFTIGKVLAGTYELDTSIAGTTAVACLLCLTPFSTDDTLGEIVATSYLGSTGMFTSIIVALLSIELLRFLSSVKALIIKMPDSVPPAIARSLNSIVPVALTVIIFGLVRVVTNIAGAPVNDLITEFIQAPVMSLVTSPVGIAVIYFFFMLIWGFGIHSAAIIGGIVEPLYLINLNANAAAIAASQAAPNIITKPFLDSLGWMGGAGNMAALVVAILLFSHRPDYRAVAKIGAVPSIFNISEPIMFGLPVVMNPILIAPMIIVTLVGIGIGALASIVGIYGPTYIMVPWITPPFVNAFLATGGSIGAVLTTVVVFVISVLIYAPFVKAMDNAMVSEDSEA